MKFIQPLIATLALSFTSFLFFTVPVTPVIAAEHENEIFISSDSFSDEKGKFNLEEYINKSSIVDLAVPMKSDSKKTMTLRYFEVNMYIHDEVSSKNVMLISAMVTDCTRRGTFATFTSVWAFPQTSPTRIQLAKPDSPEQKAISSVCDVPSSTVTTIPGENAEQLIIHAETYNREVLKNIPNG